MVSANKNKMNLCNSVRFAIVIYAATSLYRTWTESPMKPDDFVTSVAFVAPVVLPFAGRYVGEIISKTIINMFVYILGELLSYGLGKLHENEIGTEFLLLFLFIMIALGIFGRSLIKKVKDEYDYAPTAFLMAAFGPLVYPSGPDVWLTEFDRNIKTRGLACSLTILSAFLPPFFAGDEVHNEAQENIHSLADTFGDLNEKCFGLSQDLQNKLQSLINSKEKENSLGKFVCWEPRWHLHPQEQYEKIGDCIRLCASDTLSLLTNLENVQLSPDLQEKCKEIWSELAKALTLLYDSMKHKTAPAASIDGHLISAQDLANHLKKNTLELTATLKLTLHPDNTLELTAPVLKLASDPENKVELRNAVLNLALHPENTVELIAVLKLTSYHEGIHITSHSLEKLASSIKELSTLVPFKQSEDSNVSELTGWKSPQRFIPGIQEVATRANQLSDGPDTTQPRVNSV